MKGILRYFLAFLVGISISMPLMVQAGSDVEDGSEGKGKRAFSSAGSAEDARASKLLKLDFLVMEFGRYAQELNANLVSSHHARIDIKGGWLQGQWPKQKKTKWVSYSKLEALIDDCKQLITSQEDLLSRAKAAQTKIAEIYAKMSQEEVSEEENALLLTEVCDALGNAEVQYEHQLEERVSKQLPQSILEHQKVLDYLEHVKERVREKVPAITPRLLKRYAISKNPDYASIQKHPMVMEAISSILG